MNGFGNKRLGSLLIVVVILSLVGCKFETGTPSWDDVNTVSNLVVFDSIHLGGTDTLFWYCTDLGISGYSSGKVDIASNRNELLDNDLILVSNSVTGVDALSDTSIVIYYEGEKSDSTNTRKGFSVSYVMNEGIGITGRVR